MERQTEMDRVRQMERMKESDRNRFYYQKCQSKWYRNKQDLETDGEIGRDGQRETDVESERE